MHRKVCVCHTHIHYYKYIVYREYELNSMNNKGEINQKSHTWEPLAWVRKGGKGKNIKFHLILSNLIPIIPRVIFPCPKSRQ